MKFQLTTPFDPEQFKGDDGRSFLGKLAVGSWPAVLVNWKQQQTRKGAFFWVVEFESCDTPQQRGSEASYWILLEIGGTPSRTAFQGMGKYVRLLTALGRDPHDEIETEDLYGSAARISVKDPGFVDMVSRASEDDEALGLEYYLKHHAET